MTEMGNAKKMGGRPPKFLEARRPITVTLPERTLSQLNAINGDRAKAIVKAVDALVGFDDKNRPMVELVEVLPGKALLIVSPCFSLQSIPWLEMAEIAPGRHILILPSGMHVDSLEVAVLDLIENLSPEYAHEKSLLEKLRALLSRLRQKKKISKAEIIFFDVEESKK